MKKKIKETEHKKTSASPVPILADGIGTRISEICEILGTRKNAASIAGVSTDSLQRYIREEVQPPFEAVAKLAIAADKPLDWVATGKESSTQPRRTTPTSDKVEIPILDIEVSAGHGATNGVEQSKGTLAFQRQYLASRRLTAKDLRVVYAKGDSMEPEIQDGAAMLVNTADTRLDEGCIYVINLNDHLFAKRIQRGIDGSIRLISANKEYSPMEVKPNQLQDLHVQGRVVWSGREH